LSRVLSKKPGMTCNWRVVHNRRDGYFVHIGAGRLTVVLKRFLVAGLLVISIAAAAVLLFLAGDHDEEDRNSASAPSSSQSFELGRYPANAASGRSQSSIRKRS
jgi:hypothetical protein